ncbi:MAG: helical backbone metal receptor, partial [Chromatiales bacterium]|nr:helical backbone metal receptor [Chromatiales bacterium]
MLRQSSVLALLAGAVLTGGCGGVADVVPPGGDSDPVPQRIVSLAPSLTETLFALGLGDRVVGVTRFCAYPPEVLELPRVGGHLDPNFEAIVSLEPDLVVAIPSSRESGLRLESLGISVLEVDQHDVESVLESVSAVATKCGVSDRGAILREELEERLARVKAVVAEAPRPRAVVVVGHQTGGDSVRTVWAAGRDTFYDGVVQIAGGVNAIEEGLARYPELSREGLASLDADVVLDVIAGLEARNLDPDVVHAGWMQLSELRAVREHRVHVLAGDQMVVPGPRLPE